MAFSKGEWLLCSKQQRENKVATLALGVTLDLGSWLGNGVQGWSLPTPVRPRLDLGLS